MAASTENRSEGKKGRGLLEEIAECWHLWPHKALFLGLLSIWLLFFHFFGNSTLGYVKTPSLFGWMNYDYNNLEDDSHGKFIPIVVLVLCWLKRNELIAAPKQHWWPALGLVALGLAVHLLGFVVQQTRISIVGFFVGLYGVMGTVWGPRLLGAIFFPYFLFAFCVPIGTLADPLTFPLRMLVTDISVFISDTLLGIDVVKDGTKILAAQGGFNYDVSVACSGIRSLTILLAMTTIYGFTSFRSPWKRLLMVFVAIPLAVVGNVVRITGVIIIAEAFGEDAGMKFHDWAGFVTFVVALIGVFALGYWLKEDAGPGVNPEVKDDCWKGSDAGKAGLNRQSWILAGGVLALVGMTLVVLGRLQASQRLGQPGLTVVAQPIHDEYGKLAGTNSVFLPFEVLNCQSSPVAIQTAELNWLPPDTTYGRRLYTNQNGFEALLSVVLMGADRTSIHKPEYCVVGQGWQINSKEEARIPIGGARPFELRVMKLLTTREQSGTLLRGIYVYWFVAEGQQTARHTERMWWMARDLLKLGVLQRWAYVTCFAVCLPGAEEATYERMTKFIAASVPEFQVDHGAKQSLYGSASPGVAKD